MESQLILKVNELLDALEGTTGEPGDLSSILQHIAQTAKTFFAADVCVIFAINPITNQFMGPLTVAGNLLRSDNISYKPPGPEGISLQVLRRGVLLVEDLEAMPEYQSVFTRTEGIRSYTALALRLRNRQKQLGVLYLNFRQRQQFSSADHELFQLFADQASFILQETWLLQRYQAVARIGEEINHELATVDILFQKLQKHVMSILDIGYALLLAVYQPQTNALDLYIEEERHFIFRENDPLEGACQHVIETQQTLFIRQMSKETEYWRFKSHEIITGKGSKESLIFVPLVSRDVPLGVLSIQHPQPNSYNQEDLFILQLLANHIALALHNMRLYNNLSRLNETGQILTQQLKSEQTLQATVDKIRDATQADVVVLYPYEPALQRFIFPPRVAGTLLDSSSPQSTFPRQPDDIAALILRHGSPIFAKESTTIYTELNGDVHIGRGSFQQREKLCSTAAMPLRVGDESVGVLFVNYRQPQRFDATEKLVIEGLAHYAAIAIKNAQVFGTLSQRRMRELEILQNIDRELSRTLALEPVLNTLLKLAHEQVPAEEASILLYNPRVQALETLAAIGAHAETRQKRVISLQEAKGITLWVLEHKKPARVDNVHGDPQWRDLYIQAIADTVSELDVPLLDGGEVVGVLNFERTREAAFSQEDEDFLLTLAGQAVLAIKKAQAYEREKRLAEEGQVLNEISKEITSQLDHVHVFNLILEKALELTHSHMGNLMLYDANLKDLWMAAQRGVVEDKRGQRQGLDQGIVGYVARKKQLLNVDLSQPPWNEIYLEFFPGTRSELAVPMLAGDELRGVLNVESPTPNNFNESDERLLQGLAGLAVVALQNAERYTKAEKEAQRFELLYKAGQELSKITELTQLEQAYDIVLQIAEEFSQSLVVIRRYDEDTQELVLERASQHQYSSLFERTKLDVGVNGQVARERRTIVLHDTHNPPSDVVPPILSNPMARSLVITPITFKDRYYGNLGLSHEDVGYFRGTDIIFFEGLAQQLATTIYRLETAEERQEFEHRAKSAEAMSSIGQIAFELTHRWGNDLGLVRSYVNDIRSELKTLNVTSMFLSEKLENIVRAARAVLNLSKELKEALVRTGEAIAGAPLVVESRILLEEAQDIPSLPSNIQICPDIDDDVAAVRVIHSSVADILRNLVTNAIDAMPEGGKITLKARNAGRFVALDVIDTGTGIPQQSLAKIFNLFYSTKGSSGFGLWSARTNALRNHGDLTVKSQEGQGTTFTLLLPRVEREHHEALF